MFQVGDAVILDTESVSGAIDCNGLIPVAIQMPDAWDAADLTFQASVDGVTFEDVYDSADAELSVQAGANRYIVLGHSFLWCKKFKIRSGTAALAVAQTADRTLKILFEVPV